jgi:hypothetical protein
MERRAFCAIGGRAGMFTLAAGATRLDRLLAQEESEDPFEQRLAGVIQDYDAQGNHRTGTSVDDASAKWLANEVRQLGLEPSLEAFTLSRVHPQSCCLRVAGRRIGGVPIFDGGFTPAEGVHGRLGPVGGDADIGLIETSPFKLTEPGDEQRASLGDARRSRHKAAVLLTRGGRPGLFLINASAFTKPFGPPMLQVSSVETEWLKEQAEARAEATLVANVTRITARAFNVTTKVAGIDPKLAPLVFMAPRSGWWQCASEQGSRLVCWLEAMRVLAAGKPARDCHFVALSGHELGFLGMDAYVQRRQDLIRRAHAWIFYGSSIGAPQQRNLIHASDDALEQWTVAAMEKERLVVNAKTPRDAMARGEAGAVQRGGGRFVTVVCDSEVYHSVADRWPEAIDVALLARYARAFAKGSLELARPGV